MHPVLSHEIIQAHHADLRRDAARHRRVREARRAAMTHRSRGRRRNGGASAR